MNAFVLRRIIAHRVADLGIVRLRDGIGNFLRAGARRARERKIADLEAWKALCGISDDRTGNRTDDEPDY